MTSKDKDHTGSRTLNHNQNKKDTIHRVQSYIILFFIVPLHKAEI